MYLATDYEKRGGRTGTKENDHRLEFEGFSGACRIEMLQVMRRMESKEDDGVVLV